MTGKAATTLTPGRANYELLADESAAVTERLEKLVSEVEQALPNILGLTNQLATVFSNSASLTSNLNAVALGAQPTVSNLTLLTARLDHPGALGEWLLPTNINRQLEGTLGKRRMPTLASANTNLTALAENLGRSLDNLANLTSNLNSQVQANTNILGEISRAIVDADSFVQGLKHHWLLRSAFRPRDQCAAGGAGSNCARRKTRAASGWAARCDSIVGPLPPAPTAIAPPEPPPWSLLIRIPQESYR